MTREEEIIQAAKQKEKESGFTQIVKSAKGVNSAYGIGFIEGVEWADEHLRKGLCDIDKACEWLIEHKEAVETEDNGIMGWIPDYFIEDFKKYMEESV